MTGREDNSVYVKSYLLSNASLIQSHHTRSYPTLPFLRSLVRWLLFQPTVLRNLLAVSLGYNPGQLIGSLSVAQTFLQRAAQFLKLNKLTTDPRSAKRDCW
jgi:hypothetical protein